MVMRAQLTARLLERASRTTCAARSLCVLSQLDELLGEPLGTILKRLPLSNASTTPRADAPFTGGPYQMAMRWRRRRQRHASCARPSRWTSKGQSRCWV